MLENKEIIQEFQRISKLFIFFNQFISKIIIKIKLNYNYLIKYYFKNYFI